MLIFPDISKLKDTALVFGKIIILAIIVAIFYFLGDQINKNLINYFPKNPKILESEAKKQFIKNLDFNYRVVEVIDGDTLEIERLDREKVLNKNKIQKVRLIGINTPESVDPRRPVECFGKEASSYMKDISLYKIAAIEIDNSQDLYDKYDRLLAYIYIKESGIKDENAIMLNEKMIKEGYAYEYTYNLPYKYQKDFKSYEAIAKNNYLGLWSPNTCSGLKTPIAPPVNNTNFFDKVINLLNNL